jgi:hypothetical protein
MPGCRRKRRTGTYGAELVEREREHGRAHLRAEAAALVAHPDPGTGLDLAEDPEVRPGQLLHADHAAFLAREGS